MEQAAQPAEAPKPKGKKLWIVVATVVIIAIVGVAAFLLTRPPTATGNAVSIFDDGLCPSGNTVVCGFRDQTITVKVGTKVVWTNTGSIGHTVTSDSPPGGPLNSPLLNPGQTFEFTFDTAGTFGYHCTPHPWMKATVTVTS